MTIAQSKAFTVTWEKLPDDYRLPDDPVDNKTQPDLAVALTESLAENDRLPESAFTFTNYGICATVNGKIVVKAPDWGFVPSIRVPREQIDRSYTPRLEGDNPIIVMEFLSETEGTEYSVKPTYPPGKWFFYEQVLQVINYVIFEPGSGNLEFYRLNEAGQYKLQPPNEAQRYWVPEMQLFLGVWQGTRQNRTGNWLRWWTESGDLLLWGSELIAQARQLAQQERDRANRLAERLRALNLDPDD